MKKFVIGNLKMNLLSPLEREKYFEFFDKEKENKNLENVEVILCPPFVHLEAFNEWKNEKVSLGAQNIFPEMKGSYTGEISPAMVKNLGCDYVILGHSERRRYFLEKNEEINMKALAALKIGLRPVICVGESQTEKENQATMQVITKQVKECLFEISRTKAEKIIIAYEPVWAVGTDIVPTANEIMEAKVLIRKILVGMFGKNYAEKVSILYGGSVNTRTAKEVCVEPGMDGALIGRESLTPYEFLRIAEIINNN